MILLKLMKPIELLRGLSPPRILYRARVCFYILPYFRCTFILQFVCKVNAENYSDHASSAPTHQNKKSSFTMLPVHELSKIKKVVHCTPGGGGGGQSFIKERGPTVRFLPRAVQQLKCYLERT